MNLAQYEVFRNSYSNHVFCRNNEAAAWCVDESNAICLSILANPPTTPLPRMYLADFKIHCSWKVADRDFPSRSWPTLFVCVKLQYLQSLYLDLQGIDFSAPISGHRSQSIDFRASTSEQQYLHNDLAWWSCINILVSSFVVVSEPCLCCVC